MAQILLCSKREITCNWGVYWSQLCWYEAVLNTNTQSTSEEKFVACVLFCTGCLFIINIDILSFSMLNCLTNEDNMCLLAVVNWSKIEIIIKEHSISAGQLLILHINIKHITKCIFTLFTKVDWWCIPYYLNRVMVIASNSHWKLGSYFVWLKKVIKLVPTDMEENNSCLNNLSGSQIYLNLLVRCFSSPDKLFFLQCFLTLVFFIGGTVLYH